MQVNHARNVNDALRNAISSLLVFGIESPSRNGPVLRFPGPLITEYAAPRERVLFSPVRNANPTFHLMESLWMLYGRKDAQFPAEFVKRIRTFSDDGTSLWGAYGWRWRSFFGYDQLQIIIDELKRNPESRRCVLQMWNAASQPGLPMVSGDGQSFSDSDLGVAMMGGKDVPCNTAIYFDVHLGALHMTVTNRSNDLVWGLYGANAVHMSYIHEYVAAHIGLPVGKLVTISNNAHVYLEQYPREKLAEIANDVMISNLYQPPIDLKPQPLVQEGETMDEFDADLEQFFAAYDDDGLEQLMHQQYHTHFFNGTVTPMLTAWIFKKHEPSHSEADRIASTDWRQSMKIWLATNYGSDHE